jgi:intracellular multiplication protein IcmP
MSPAPPQQGAQDNHMAPIWLVLGVFVVVLAIWYFLKVEIYEAFAFIKIMEIDVISLFTPALDGVKQSMLAIDPKTVAFIDMERYASQIGIYIAVPSAILLVIGAVVLYRRSIGLRFKHVYHMKKLLKFENKLWPQSTPILDQDLVKTDIEKGVWAMAQTPMQFAKKHQLLREQDIPFDEMRLARESGVTVSLIKSKSVQIFIKQMGPLWRGVDALNIHTKAIFAILAARIGDDSDAAQKMIYHIAASAKGRRLDFSGVNAMLKKYQNQKSIQTVIGHHAYESTVMASLLELARHTGVVASADFLWVKMLDRRLWFTLNMVGRQTPSIEVAAPFAHWIIEKELQKKVRTPMLDEAVKGLDRAISEVIYVPDEKEEK